MIEMTSINLSLMEKIKRTLAHLNIVNMTHDKAVQTPGNEMTVVLLGVFCSRHTITP